MYNILRVRSIVYSRKAAHTRSINESVNNSGKRKCNFQEIKIALVLTHLSSESEREQEF